MANPDDNEKWWTAPTPTPAPAPYVSPLMWLIQQQQQQPAIVARPAPAARPTVMQQINAPAPPPTNTTPYHGGMYAPKNYYNTATPFSTGQAPYSGQGTYMPQTSPPPQHVYTDEQRRIAAQSYYNPPVLYTDWYKATYGARAVSYTHLTLPTKRIV